MSDRWVTDRETDTTSPFYLRRDVLDVLDEEIETGGAGGSGRVVSFSQAAGAAAIIGGSPKYVVTGDGTISGVLLATTSAPIGGPLTVQFRLNGSVFATLQIADGSTATTQATVDAPVIALDELTVSSTAVGTTIATQGITAMITIT